MLRLEHPLRSRRRLPNLAISALAAALLPVAACTSDPADSRDEVLGTTRAALGTQVDSGTAGGPVWNWVGNVPGARCGYGSQAGFAVSPGSGSEILIYFEGGGSCWDKVSCELGVDKFRLAYNLSGYGQTEFLSDGQRTASIFQRGAPNNPFATATYVFVPSCTGDFFSGSTTQTWSNGKTMYYYGRKNLDLFLSQLIQEFPNASRVTLAGTSAGGFGAEINYEHIRQAFFPGKRVDLISDSGPFLFNSGFVVTGVRNNTWNSKAAFPACATDPDPAKNCWTNFRNIYAYYDRTYTDSSFAFLEYDQDLAMGVEGYTQLPWDFTNTLRNFALDTLGPLRRTKYFIPDSNANYNRWTHGLLGTSCFGPCAPQADINLQTAQPRVYTNGHYVNSGSSTTLATWLTAMHDNSGSWANATGMGMTCTPTCSADSCGSDGCGGTCGASSAGDLCDENGNSTPVPDTTCMTAGGSVRGAIGAKYLALGACSSVLGAPTSSIRTPPDQTGRYNLFENGSIYWYPSTGAHEVHGAIRTLWGKMGWETSILGYPKSDQIPTTTGTGQKSLFQSGVIYSTATGTWAVRGAIGDKYASLGYEAGALGLPTSDERVVGIFGEQRRQYYEHGYINWHPISGTTVSYN